MVTVKTLQQIVFSYLLQFCLMWKWKKKNWGKRNVKAYYSVCSFGYIFFFTFSPSCLWVNVLCVCVSDSLDLRVLFVVSPTSLSSSHQSQFWVTLHLILRMLCKITWVDTQPLTKQHWKGNLLYRCGKDVEVCFPPLEVFTVMISCCLFHITALYCSSSSYLLFILLSTIVRTMVFTNSLFKPQSDTGWKKNRLS